MKTIEQVTKEIDRLISQRPFFEKEDDDKKREKLTKKANKEIEFLKNCLFYLEGNPREDFVKQQLEKIESKVELIVNGFAAWNTSEPNLDGKDLAQRKAQYSAYMDLKTLKLQIKTLTYILN